MVVTDVSNRHACSHYFAFMVINSHLHRLLFVITNEMQKLHVQHCISLHQSFFQHPCIYFGYLVQLREEVPIFHCIVTGFGDGGGEGA